MTLFPAIAGRRIGIWGAGIEGRAAADALRERNEVTVVGSDPGSAQSLALAGELGVQPVTPDEAASAGLDLVVRSPGVSIHGSEAALFLDRSVPLTTLLSLWLEHHRPPVVIGVTGTKGKSSTALILAELLRHANRPVEVVGNIGRAVTEATGAELAVIEVSSYQAADITSSPDYGILTNLGVDHLPWHGNEQQYHLDKLQLFSHPGLHHLALGVPISDHLPLPLSATVATVGPGTYEVLDQRLFRHGAPVGDLAGTPFAIEHFGHNLALACITFEAATAHRVNGDLLARVCASFELPPARMEDVPASGEVRWVCDALASNPMGAAAGVSSLRSSTLGLIVGGAERGVPLDPLIEAMREHGDVRFAVAIGEVAATWCDELRAVCADVRVLATDDVQEAVRLADSLASAGDVILFSPGAPTTPAVGDWSTRRTLFIEQIRRLHPDILPPDLPPDLPPNQTPTES